MCQGIKYPCHQLVLDVPLCPDQGLSSLGLSCCSSDWYTGHFIFVLTGKKLSRVAFFFMKCTRAILEYYTQCRDLVSQSGCGSNFDAITKSI